MIEPVSSVFLTLWNTLAKSNTCPELEAAWNAIMEQAVLTDPRALNELWDFYLERLGVLEKQSFTLENIPSSCPA